MVAFFATEPIFFGISWLTPLPFLLIISIVLSIIVSLVYKYMTDQTLMKELKKDLKKYQDAMKESKDDVAKTSELSKKAMAVNMKYMKQTLKPMLITMIPFILIFWWLKSAFTLTEPIIHAGTECLSPVIISLSFWPCHLGWIGTYIIFSMVFTTVFRKILKVA